MNRRNVLADFSRIVLGGLAAGVSLACGPALAQASATPATATNTPLMLVVGDSLSAEYGLIRGTGWVALMEKRLRRENVPARIVNASISGDTTSGGRSRLPALLAQHRPALVIVELGGNDALRGLPLALTRDNLTAMTRAAQAAGATVVLAGMQLPPNYGRTYGDGFAKLYADIASKEKAALVPFLLRGVGDVANAESYFQSDRIHPNQSAQPILMANVWPVVVPLLTPSKRK